MEIKKGQIWRNVHGEVEVIEVTAFSVTTEKAKYLGPLQMDKPSFLATHEFVRDPKPEIKEGDWVMPADMGKSKYEVQSIDGGTAYLFAPNMGGIYPVEELTPCDPPPLHKALRELVESFQDPLGHSVYDNARKVADLYSEGER